MLSDKNISVLLSYYESYYDKYIDNDGYMYGFTSLLLTIPSIRCKYFECYVYYLLDALNSLTKALDSYFFLLC